MIEQVKDLIEKYQIPHAVVTDETYRVRVGLGQIEVHLYEADSEIIREKKVSDFVAWIKKMNGAALLHPKGHEEPEPPKG